MGVTILWEATPWHFALLQAALGVVQVGLLHLQLYHFGTEDDFEVLGIEPSFTGETKHWSKLRSAVRIGMIVKQHTSHGKGLSVDEAGKV